MPMMEISIVPVGTSSASVSRFVAGAVKALKEEKKIKYRLTPMGTVVEAHSVNELLKVAEKMHETVVKMGTKRVLTSIKLDDRKDAKLSMEGKIKSVKSKLKKT